MSEQKAGLQARAKGAPEGCWRARVHLGSPSVLCSRFRRSSMVWVGPPPPSPKPKRKALWLVRPLSRLLTTVFRTWIGRAGQPG